MSCVHVPMLQLLVVLVLIGCGGTQKANPRNPDEGTSPPQIGSTQDGSIQDGARHVTDLPPPPGAKYAEVLEREWGIRIESLRVSNAGFLVDFRYRVLDSELAIPLMKKDVHPTIFHPRTGVTLRVPSGAKTGPMRNSGTPKVGIIYFILFNNSRRAVKSGDLIDLTVGDLELPGIHVQ